MDNNNQIFPDGNNNNNNQQWNQNNNPQMYGQNPNNNGNYYQQYGQNIPDNPYGQPFNYGQPNNYQPQNNYIPPQNNFQQPYNMQYAEPPKKKSPAGMYIILIAVIVFFAVIIVAMSTIMKAMVNKNNKDTDNDVRGNMTLSENDDERKTENSEKDSEKDNDEKSAETVITTVAETEPVPEVVTVTVIVEVPAEPEPVPVQNYTDIYDSGFYGYIATKKDPLNLREEPNSDSKILTTIPKGTGIYFHKTNLAGWYLVSYNGKSGYVSSDYVTIGQSSANNTLAWTAIIATKSDPLNLRETASKNGKIITTIPKGTTVNVIEYGSEWTYISWGQYSGYASTDYLSFGQ